MAHRVTVIVKPGVKRPGIEARDGVLTVRIRERAVEGAANAALIEALAAFFRVAPSRITLVRGAQSRKKLVEIDGLHDLQIHEEPNV